MSLQNYLNLIPPPNNIQPKFMAWVQANIQVYVDSQAVIAQIITAFTIDTAVGAQLDVLGQILQVSRTLTFQPGGGLNPVLTDDQYRVALKSKIIQNQWKGTKQEIYDFWTKFLPQYPVLIQDNQDMTMSVLVVGMPNDISGSITFGYDSNTSSVKGYDAGYWTGFNSVLRGMVTNGYFTPKPAGVTVNYSFLDTPAFSYDENSTLLQGYDGGYWPSFS